MRKILVSLFLIVCFSGAFSQNVSDDLFKMNRAYRNFKDLSMNMTYLIFASHKSVTPQEVYRGIFKKQGEAQYSRFMGIQTLSTKNFFVTADSSEKEIILSNPANQANLFLPKTDIDNYLKLCSKTEFFEPKPGLIGYRLFANPKIISEYSRVDIHINKKTFLVERLILYYGREMNSDESGSKKDKPRMEIFFSNIDTHPEFSPDEFSESRFFVQNGEDYKVTKEYSEYQLINKKISW